MVKPSRGNVVCNGRVERSDAAERSGVAAAGAIAHSRAPANWLRPAVGAHSSFAGWKNGAIRLTVPFKLSTLAAPSMNTFVHNLFVLAFLVCPIAALMLIVRLAIAPFSSKVSGEMRRHPVIHVIWGGIAFGSVLIFSGIVNPAAWPSVSVERKEQRAKLADRVHAAGGWDAIRRDCVRFAEQNTNGFYSHFRDTNGLPAAVVALKPMTVEYQPQFGCVRIRIFGMHSTGGHSRPYFGLEVDTSTNSVSNNHGAGYGNGGVIGNRHTVAEKVAEGIYELY